jgi:hypothetical protein
MIVGLSLPFDWRVEALAPTTPAAAPPQHAPRLASRAKRLLRAALLQSIHVSAHVIYTMLAQKALDPFVEREPIGGRQHLPVALEFYLKGAIQHEKCFRRPAKLCTNATGSLPKQVQDNVRFLVSFQRHERPLKPGSGERRVLLSPCGLVIRRIVHHIWTTDAVHNRQMLPGDTPVSSLRINN